MCFHCLVNNKKYTLRLVMNNCRMLIAFELTNLFHIIGLTINFSHEYLKPSGLITAKKVPDYISGFYRVLSTVLTYLIYIYTEVCIL